jgi:predicted MFS family arabinose efflux permease
MPQNGLKARQIPTLLREAVFLRLALTVFLFNAGYSIYMLLFNFLLASEGQHEARMGSLTGAMVLGGVLGALPASQAANRWGCSKTLSVSLIFCSVFLGLRLVPSPFAVQWVLAALSGLFLSGWMVLIFPLIAAIAAEKQRASAFQILYGLATAAGCAGAVVGGNLPALCTRVLPRLSATDAQRIGLLLGAVLVCLSTLSLPQTKAEKRVQTVAGIHPTKRLTTLLLASALWAFLLGALNPFSGIFFQSQFRMELPAIGDFFFLVQAIVAIGLIMTGASHLARLPGWIIFLGAQLVVAAAFLGMATRALWLAEAAYLSFMFAQQLSQPVLQAMLLHSTSTAERNSIAAWNTMLTAIAQSIAAPAFGLLWGHWGYATVLPFLALATVLAAGSAATSLHASSTAA